MRMPRPLGGSLGNIPLDPFANPNVEIGGAPMPNPIKGLGGAAMDHLIRTGAAPSLDVRDMMPATPFAPPSAMPEIQPVPIAKVDGQGRLRSLMTQAYKAMPGEDAAAVSKRIGALNDLSSKIDALGPITPDDADAIFDSWYQSVMQPPAPYAEFTPEAQQAIQDAYGGTIPQPRVAGAKDVDPNEAAAVAAFTLVNALTGKGNFGDVLKGAGMVQGRAQQRVDLQTQAQIAQDEARRRGAVARFQRITQVEDFNNEQRGYDAKGKRDADRQIAVQNAITDRGEGADDRRFKRDMAGKYFDFLSKGDSGRAADVKAYVESQLKTKLDDRFNEIDPTAQEKNVAANTAHTQADTGRIKAVVRGLGLKNDLDEQAFGADLQGRIARSELTQEQVEKLRAEVDHLPEKWRLEKLKIDTDVEATKTRAAAALIRANKAGTGAAKADPARKMRLDGLKAVVTTQNTVLDNLSQRYNHWYELAADLDYQIQKATRRGGDAAAKLPELQRQFSEAKGHYTSLSSQMKDSRDKASKAADEIDTLSKGP